MSPGEDADIGVKITADDKASKSLKGVQQSLKGIGSSLAGLIGVLPGFNMLMGLAGWVAKVKGEGGFKAYTKALIQSTIATLKLGIATLVALWPIILIIAAVVAAIMIAILIYQNWGNIADWLKDKWDTFLQWLHKIWEWIVGIATTLWTTFKTFITGIWNTILTVGTTIWNAITGTIMNLWNTAITFVKEKLGWIWGIIKTVWGLIKAVTEGDWNAVKGIIKDVLIALYNAVIHYVGKIIDKIGTIPIIGPYLAGGAKWLLGLSGIPGFQFGTRYVMHDTLAMVHKGERIIPRHSATSYNTSSYAPVFNITVNATLSSEVDVNNLGRTLGEIAGSELRGMR